MKDYNAKQIEKKWQKFWEDNKIFYTDLKDFSKPKYYILDMFPYPSAAGLHVGHMEGYTATDVVARMKRMQGFNVLHPMGYDSFGLPAEQYAIKTGNHPGTFTKQNIEIFRKQLKNAGFSYDWDKEISTCDESYYKWTQWIFKQLYLDGYAKYVDMPVNWCEELGTVLANDEIIDGKSERGGFPVVRKNMKQWIITIPAYAERLLEGLKELDWPEGSIETQRNWIGKSFGANVDFAVDGTNEKFTVFTTRCDTLFGATYCVLAPEHALVEKITSPEQKQAVEEYKAKCAAKSELERTELSKEKTGVFVGAYAINPVNGVKIPIYISDYVLTSYGTGAIMAVPAHDERDYAFAQKFGLDIIQVLEGGDISKEAFVGDGKHINSGFLDGLNKQDAIDAMAKWLEEHNCGHKTVTYKLRDWVFARQRYWGEPVPVVHMNDGSTYVLKDEELPLVLPEMEDYKSKGGRPPLDNATEWKNVSVNGKEGVRETATMPGSAASSWYFLRYIDPHNDKEFASYDLLKHWLPVDFYFGGAEHLVGHLLYSRFWNNYLFDKGLVPVKEPFKKLKHPGMVLGPDGRKMSKSWGNVINPDSVIDEFGADSLRLCILFMGPIDVAKPWSADGASSARKFIERVYRIFGDKVTEEKTPELDKVYNETVKKVTEDFESMYFNTAISQIMILVNAIYKLGKVNKEYAEGLIKLLSPITPHMAEEIWEELGHKESIAYATWPVCDETKLVQEQTQVPVQVNGKLRGVIVAKTGATQEEVLEIAKQDAEISKHLEGTIKKIIYVPGRIFNIIM